jgi:hypothetical protein
MWEIGLTVFARHSLRSIIGASETATKATGIAGIAGNKVCCCCCYYYYHCCDIL